MTSEGGGAVVFPAMTLAFNISPVTARDVSILLQACGMTAASFTIFFVKVQCEWRALGLSAAGGVLGLIIGLEFLDQRFTPVQKKMGFVSIWFSFASVLLFLVIFRKEKVHNRIKRFDCIKATIVLIVGFIGGIFTALVGSGLDICMFSILTLLFRVSEKVATPTSVILMASNSIVAVIWRGIMMQGISTETWEFLAVCIPVVVIGAPLGSVLGSHFHRNVLAMLVIVLDTIALITAYIVIPQTLTTGLLSAGMILGGLMLFSFVAYVGQKLNRDTESDDVDRIVEINDKFDVIVPAEGTGAVADESVTKLSDD